ncbi:unnamed protein product [Moneuplotes crassus]|uniref:Uncharacterized protein n=1 Tax=Euplotes crassus TaxID=5936 RepID=A0AAD1XRB8_EUPCR|nr:unnamed protein product [Moneuplotes crassus]
MGSFLHSLTILVLVVAIVPCNKGYYLSDFKDKSTGNLGFMAKRIEKNVNIVLMCVGLVEMVWERSDDYGEVERQVDGIWQAVLKDILYCDEVSCITPVYMLYRVMKEFRVFARHMVTEMKYSCEKLRLLYYKKLLGVITKIIHDKGKDAFDAKSRCIRMRIGQFFMPTFKGNDTSDCSEFDEIIHSFSEQSDSFWRDFWTLIFEILCVIVLALLIRKSSQLLFDEWEIYKDLNKSSIDLTYQTDQSYKYCNLHFDEVFEQVGQ